MSTVFGPVPSRRLGRSLGIDVIPAKTCTYDCIYCESGRTTHLAFRREQFVAPEEVMHDLERYFRNHPGGADVLTLSSAGEPTLYLGLGDLLRSIKKHYPHLPLVVLTNGSLLWDPQVREDLLPADRVAPTLTGTDTEVFRSIHRPHPGLVLPDVLEGLRSFRREYHGELCLEVMLVEGCNDRPLQWRELRRIVDGLHPDLIELNTVVRPPADPNVRGLSRQKMEEALEFFPRNISRIIGGFSKDSAPRTDGTVAERVIELVGRRPCTAAELVASLAVSPTDLAEALTRLEEEKKLVRSLFDGREYVCPPSQSPRTH